MAGQNPCAAATSVLYVADGRISQGWRAHQQAFCKTCCMQLAVAIYSGLFRHISMSSKYNQTVCLEWSIAVEYWQQVHGEINRLYLHLLSHPVTIHPSGRCLEAIAAPNHKRNGHGEHGEQHHLRRLQEIHGPIHGPIMSSLRKPFLLRASGASTPKSAHNISQPFSSGSEVHNQFDQDPRQENGTYCCVPKSRNWGNPTALPGPARMKCLGSPGARDPQVSCCWQCQTPVKRRLRLHHAPSPYIYTFITKKILYCPS